MNKKNLVVKANKLVCSRYELSLEEQRIILAVVSKLDSRLDKQFEVVEISIKEFANLIGIENPNYTYMKEISKKLLERVVEIEDNQILIQTHWVSSFIYKKDSGVIKIKLDNILKPYLLQLKEQFTKYRLENILQMRSKYSIRMYELLKANEYKKELVINFDEITKILCCESYNHFSNFMRRVVDPAIKEINTLTDLFVVYSIEKRYKKPNILTFNIIQRNKVERTLYKTAKELVELNP